MMQMFGSRRRGSRGFTLIELLVVISIIAVLMGLSFPVLSGMMDRAKSVQAKNDLVQLVTGVNAYYTEYGKYPLPPTSTGDVTFGESDPKTNVLMDVLRANGYGLSNTLNPRQIPFVSWPVAKDAAKPKGGIGPKDGQPYDPWGKVYIVRIDGDYDNSVDNPYSANAGFSKIGSGVIAWSAGKDGKFGSGDKNSGDAKDDIISWQ